MTRAFDSLEVGRRRDPVWAGKQDETTRKQPLPFGLAWLLVLICAAPLHAQKVVEPEPRPSEAVIGDLPPQSEANVSPGPKSLGASNSTSSQVNVRSLATLEALRESREAKRQEIASFRAALDPNVDSDLRLQQLQELRSMQTELQELDYNFESIATGIDVRAFEMGVEEQDDLVTELTKFLQPMLAELRRATEAPRELERLRKLLATVEEQEAASEAATRSITKLLEATLEPSLRESLEASLATWQGRLKDLKNQRSVAEFQLERYLDSRRSVLDSTRDALAKFFKTRGLNLLFALIAFTGILFGLRLVHRVIRRFLPTVAKEDRPFYSRFVDVLYFALSGIIAVAGALLVLYTTGDWALLGLAILALLGLAWASKTALPMFFEQINLLLNLGTVRENERVIVNGLPYRVSRISLYVELQNPALTGATVRLPLRDLPTLRSRPCVADESWFPTQGGDWIKLPDGRLGRVERQTLEVVRVKLKGGSLLNYVTTEFFSLGVENLSYGFRITQRFGIDYEYQAICTTEVPAKMRAQLEEKLAALTQAGQVRKISVEFLEAGASSLDYAILCDFDGSAAGEHNDLNRAIQRILVDTCTAEGWVIPFTQVTLHQAATPANA